MDSEIKQVRQQKLTTVMLGRVLIKIANLINVRFGPLCGPQKARPIISTIIECRPHQRSDRGRSCNPLDRESSKTM
jgi:hypothetical protein